MTTDQPAPSERKRSRSPSYPAIDLGEALKRARVLYSAETEHTANVNTILSHWGYEPKSGAGLVILAALKKFGLLVEQGKGSHRRASLSRAAMEILLDEREDSTERERLVQEAALRPTIHSQLWKEYGGSLPSEKNLKHQLRFDRGFTDRGVTEFIPQFRRTLAYANLIDGGKLSVEDGDTNEQKDGFMTPPPADLVDKPADATKRETRVFQIPISGNESAALQITYPLTKKGWAQLTKVLEAMEPGMVEGDQETALDTEDEEAGE